MEESTTKSFLLLSTVDMFSVTCELIIIKNNIRYKIAISLIRIQFYANLDNLYHLKPDMIWLSGSKFTKVVLMCLVSSLKQERSLEILNSHTI